MSIFLKTLIGLEIIICFVLALGLFSLGLMLAPVQIAYLFAEGFGSMGSYAAILILMSLVGGVSGFAALLGLTFRLMGFSRRTPNRNVLLILIIFGYSGIFMAGAIVIFIEPIFLFILSLPAACGVHLMYLEKEYLFGINNA